MLSADDIGTVRSSKIDVLTETGWFDDARILAKALSTDVVKKRLQSRKIAVEHRWLRVANRQEGQIDTPPTQFHLKGSQE